MDELPALLTQALNRRGYGSRSALADRVGVRPGTVTKWTLGQTKPHPNFWGAIEQYLNLEPGTIENIVGPPVRRSNDHSSALTDLEERIKALEQASAKDGQDPNTQETALLTDYRKLSDKEQKQVKTLVTRLLESET